MVNKFKLGDTVTLVRFPGATPESPHGLPFGKPGKVVNPKTSPGYVKVEGDGYGGHAHFLEEELELVPLPMPPVPATPKWSDVKEGDTVTFEDIPTGQRLTAEATARGGAGSVLVLGAYTGSILTQDTRRLISIERPEPPKPALPKAPGSIVSVSGADYVKVRPNAWVFISHHVPLGRDGMAATYRDSDFGNVRFAVVRDASEAVASNG